MTNAPSVTHATFVIERTYPVSPGRVSPPSPTRPPSRAGSAVRIRPPATTRWIFVSAAVRSFAVVYRAQIAGSAAASLGGDASHESLAGAVAAAATLPVPLDALVLTAARDAFTSSMHVVAAASALVLFAVAALVLTCLRHIRPIGSPRLSQPTTSNYPVDTPDLALA